MAHLSDYTQVIKHNNFIKTEGRLWPIAAEAMAQTGVICYPLTTMTPHSITHCTKSCDRSRVQRKRTTWERATLIKPLLNLTVSVRYSRAITEELLLLPSSHSYFALPLYLILSLFSVFLLFCSFM